MAREFVLRTQQALLPSIQCWLAVAVMRLLLSCRQCLPVRRLLSRLYVVLHACQGMQVLCFLLFVQLAYVADKFCCNESWRSCVKLFFNCQCCAGHVGCPHQPQLVRQRVRKPSQRWPPLDKAVYCTPSFAPQVTTKPEWVEQDQFGMPTPGGKMQVTQQGSLWIGPHRGDDGTHFAVVVPRVLDGQGPCIFTTVTTVTTAACSCSRLTFVRIMCAPLAAGHQGQAPGDLEVRQGAGV